ncbi:MAG: hypothetical protein AAGM67_06380 [Bacteroidota bacterium]
MNKNSIKILFLLPLLFACREGQVIVIPDNDPPAYNAIPLIVIENYINRLYIDLLGREPLSDEKDNTLALLRAEDLSSSVRDSIVRELQRNTEFIPIDSSYRRAYAWRQYELAKERVLEGASEALIAYRIDRMIEKAYEDSLKGDQAGIVFAREEQAKLEAVQQIPYLLKSDEMQYGYAFESLVQNYIYDDIHKGTANFIDASFSDLLGRFPTESEYDNAFQIIEFNIPGFVLGKTCTNKAEYTRVLVQSREFAEANIRWAYSNLLSRQPSSEEMLELVEVYFVDQDFEKVQRKIMTSDEYAQF